MLMWRPRPLSSRVPTWPVCLPWLEQSILLKLGLIRTNSSRVPRAWRRSRLHTNLSP